MAFSFHEHTADVLVECTGDSFTEVLVSAANALYTVTLTRVLEETAIPKTFILAGSRPYEEHLVRFLQEIIFLLDVEHFVARRFSFTPLPDGGFTVEMQGYACAADDRETEVKAATYHGNEIQQHDGRWIAQIVLDL